MADNLNIERIKLVVQALGELSESCVFVGGATVQFYIQDDAGDEIRPTDDVDCVVKVLNRFEYHDFEESLRRKGFRNDMEDGVICR